MKTFDDIEVRRPALARSYLELIKAEPGRRARDVRTSRG